MDEKLVMAMDDQRNLHLHHVRLGDLLADSTYLADKFDSDDSFLIYFFHDFDFYFDSDLFPDFNYNFHFWFDYLPIVIVNSIFYFYLRCSFVGHH